MLTIDVPAYDPALLSIEETRVAAGLTSSDSSRDTELNTLRLRISAAITKECKVAASGVVVPTLREEEVTETFRLKSRQEAVFLGRKPIVSVTSVTEVASELGASDYETEGEGLYRLTGSDRGCWACGLIEVSYIAGYEIVPDDLKLAAVTFIQAVLAQGSRDPMLRRVKIEGVSEREWWVDPTKEAVMPPEVRSMLEAGGYINKWSWMR